jgi:hypothetical protein
MISTKLACSSIGVALSCISSLSDYSFKSVETVFLIEWNEVRLMSVAPQLSWNPNGKRPRPNDDGKDKRICFAFNDGYSCTEGRDCKMVHVCMCCGKAHPSMECSKNNLKRRAVEIHRGMVKPGDKGGDRGGRA